ncbi:MAG: hypothetical protein GY952_05385 [Rhodobacteraceae bacterium]|nr:hypothetical protein [Paracoccaceae bacterium]
MTNQTTEPQAIGQTVRRTLTTTKLVWATLRAVPVAALLGLTSPALAGSDPFQDVYDICNNHNIFLEFRESSFTDRGWVPRKGGLTTAETRRTAYVSSVVKNDIVAQPAALGPALKAEISELATIKSDPNGSFGRVKIFEKGQPNKSTLLVIDAGERSICLLSRADSLADGDFISAFAALGPIKDTAFSRFIRVGTDWEQYSSGFDARTELTAVSLKPREIGEEIGADVSPVAGLILVTQIRKRE